MRRAPGALFLFSLCPLLVVGVVRADKRDPAASSTAGSATAPSGASTAAVEGDDDDDPATDPRPGSQVAPRGPTHTTASSEGYSDESSAGERPVAVPQPVYHGVSPGTEGLPPRAPRLPLRGPVRMTWPGFQVQNGVATVFLQLTGEPEWEAAQHPDKIVYTLRRTTVPLANNRRALDVGEFGTVVKSVSARQKGRDVEITILLKQKATHRERNGEAAGGFRFLVIELLPS